MKPKVKKSKKRSLTPHRQIEKILSDPVQMYNKIEMFMNNRYYDMNVANSRTNNEKMAKE